MKNLHDFTNEELLQKRKILKTSKIIDATLVGITAGIFVFSAVNNGLSFFTFFPLIIGYLIVKNSKNNKILENEVEKEITARNLK